VQIVPLDLAEKGSGARQEEEDLGCNTEETQNVNIYI
jgi:hypothetical protein